MENTSASSKPQLSPAFVLTAAQARAMGEWVEQGEWMASVQVELDLATGDLLVTQGDSSVAIDDDGTPSSR